MAVETRTSIEERLAASAARIKTVREKAEAARISRQAAEAEAIRTTDAPLTPRPPLRGQT